MSASFTRTEAAARINGREYGEEMPADLEKEMASAGLVAIFGASDDLLEFTGAIYEEVVAYGGVIVHVTPDEHVHSDDDAPVPEGSFWVEATFSPDDLPATWLIESQAPGSPFHIMEDGELFGRGLVIDLREAFAAHRSSELVKAAAPDMLAALITARDHIVTLGGEPDHGIYGDAIQAAVLDVINAAIAKATGEATS